MANNHQGSLEHGKRIIKELADVAQKAGVRAAIKFQFRDLDTLIHPSYRESAINKHIARFLSTRLSEKQFSELAREAWKRNLITMATPFDELSVDMIERLGIDVVKVASSSAQDWPLLERVALVGKPVVCSIGGFALEQIDKTVRFFREQKTDFALMHCVAMYPVPAEKLHLDQIEVMRKRYPDITIGFSTHEDPGNFAVVGMAYAKGARLFEKHVGIPTDTIKLNGYSATPDQVLNWLAAHKEAVKICGEGERKIEEKEKEDHRSLMRGVYAKKLLKAGSVLKRQDVFFAMPLLSGQLASSQWREELRADKDYDLNHPLNETLA